MSEEQNQQTSGGVDEDAIRRRAYELSQEEGAGSPEDNWARAERELRGDKTEGSTS